MKRRIIGFCLVICMVFSTMSIYPTASLAATYGIFEYEVLNGQVTITGCDHSVSGSVDIPSSINGYPVTTIGECAFESCSRMTNVTIPNSIKAIENSAFRHCSGLTSITIPSSVTSIGDLAFYGCDSMVGISVNSYNLYYSSDNYGVLFNKNKTCLIQYPRANTTRNYSVPDGVTTIEYGAFDNCKLTSVTIPGSVKIIGTRAFACSYNLSSVMILDGVKTIGEQAFYWCESLQSITIPKSVTKIGSIAFFWCDNLKDVYYNGSAWRWDFINKTGNEFSSVTTLHFEEKIQEIPVSYVSMMSTSATIKVGDTYQAMAYCMPTNATDKTLTWSTNNPLVATVNNNGVVTAKGPGKATITAKSHNGKSASCTVNVVSKTAKMDGNYRYSFSNWPDSFGYSNEKDEKGNIIKINYKIPKERYLQLGYTEKRAKDSVKTWGGNCFGMSMSSILFYKNILKEENYHIQGLYYKTPSFPIELLFPDQNKKLREMIELLHISQNLNSAIAKPFSLTEVIEELSSNKPIILGMYEKGRKKGHAIVISGYSQNGSSYDLEFYDCGNYITSITCDVNSRITLTCTQDAPNWKLFEYYCYDNLCNIYLDILKNGKDSISLFSNNSTDSYTQIITLANDMSISNSQGETINIQDGEIYSDINNIKVIPSSYLAEEQTYTIILPTDTYTIVGSGDEVITTSFADDYMTASVSVKSSTPITISSDLKEISVDTAIGEEYDITYTTYDNIFDEMNLSGTATGIVTTKLNDADILISGVNTLIASVSVSDSVVSANSDGLSNSDEITVKCEETDSGAILQILSTDAELTDKTSLPERLIVAAPTYDLVSGTYTEGQVLNFTKDDDTIIYYTTDGSIPSTDNGTVFSLPIDINKSMTVKAISTKYGYLDSEVIELNYILPEVDVPLANVETGDYDEVITVELFTGNYEDTVYYTLDGSNPLENGVLYTAPINISGDVYLQAYTLRNGCISEISEYEYTVTPNELFYFANSLTNQDGTAITAENLEGLTKVKMTFTRLQEGEHSGLFLLAFYDADGRVISAKYVRGTIDEEADEVEIDITDDVSTAHMVRAFAWSESLQPICDKWEEIIVNG